MNALIVDALGPEVRAGLESLGLQVTEDTALDSHSLPGAMGSVDILIVGHTHVTRRTIEATTTLKLIIHAGSGVASIDVGAASERGVFVSHCARAEATARAELIMGLFFALDRGLSSPLPAATRGLGAGLSGRSLGLYGWDATAAGLRAIAAGVGLRVHVFAPGLTQALASEAGVHLVNDPDALLSSCDLVSLHPGPTDTGVIATAERLAALPPNAALVNITRRGLIDLGAAAQRLAAGTLGVGLDVYELSDFGDEVPFAADAFPNLIATFGRASRTAQAHDAIARAVVGHVETFLLTEEVPDCVNLDAAPVGGTRLTVHYRPDRTVLASLFEALRGANTEVRGAHTGHLDDGTSAFIRLTIDRAPSPSLVTAILRHPAVLRLDEHG